MVDLAIRALNLTKKFGDELAVRNVSFEIPRGTILGFVGPSGSGKTTTVRLLTGIYRPTAGQAYVLGRQPAQFDQQTRARIGYMPQHFVLYPQLTVWENLNFAASIYGVSPRRGGRLRELLEFVELYPHRHKLARQISGGMQRRLSLAATLVHNPELLFLDEPAAGVDPVLRRKFWEYFRELQGQGRTVFVTTQYVGEAAYCDLIGVMAEGQLLMVETPEGLRHRAYGGDVVTMATDEAISFHELQALQQLPFVRGKVERFGTNGFRIVVGDAATAMPALVNWAQDLNVNVESIEQYLPPFDDVFVELMSKTEAPDAQRVS